MKKFQQFIKEDQDYIKNISHFHMIPNSQLGTNPGGIHKDPTTGEHHYLKFYKDENQARNEVAAGGIYSMMGIPNTNPYLGRHNGRLAVGSKWNPNLETQEPHDFDNLSEKHKGQLAKHFLGAVVTKNWDAVGAQHDNLLKHNYTDEHHAADLGAAFEHRARGALKPMGYDRDIGEFHTMRDPDRNPENAHVFGQLKPAHIQAAKQSLQSLTHEKVHTLFQSVGMHNAAEKTDTLMARRAALLEA